MESSQLNQFVVLAQSAQGRACEALVRQALEHSGVYNFGELLDCPNVQALANGAESQRLVEVLRIFAFGTYSDYKARQAELPELTAPQKRKLQLLTVVSLATKDKLIKFSDLQAAVDVYSPRELEDLIIEAVYQNLIAGKMDQENQCLIIESCSCRDCRDEDVDEIIATLSWWHDSAQKMTSSLDGMVQYTADSYENNRQSREDLEKLVQTKLDSWKEGDGGKASSGDGGSTRMASDDADEESKRAKSTRGRWMGSIGGASRGKH